MLSANFMAASAAPGESTPAAQIGVATAEVDALNGVAADSFESLLDQSPFVGKDDEGTDAATDDEPLAGDASGGALPSTLTLLPVLLMQMGLPVSQSPAVSADGAGLVGQSADPLLAGGETSPLPASGKGLEAARSALTLPMTMTSDRVASAATTLPTLPAEAGTAFPALLGADATLPLSAKLENAMATAVLGPNDAGSTTSILGMAQAAPAAPSLAKLETVVMASPQDSMAMADAVAAKVGWMTDQKVTHAEIRLSAPDLGDIDIRLALDGQQVSAEFASQAADVRALVEVNMPRLREMLQSQGMQLVRAEVGGSFQQSTQQQQQHPQQSAAGMNQSLSLAPGSKPDTQMAVLVHRPSAGGGGLLDAYA